MDASGHKVLAVIMGGGRGTRLFPLTQQRCKPAVPLAGTYRLVDIPISNCINSGYQPHLCADTVSHRLAAPPYPRKFSVRPVWRWVCRHPLGRADGSQHRLVSRERRMPCGAICTTLLPHAHDLVLILSGDQLYRWICGRWWPSMWRPGPRSRSPPRRCRRRAPPAGSSARRGLWSITAFVEKPTEPKVIDSLVMPLRWQGTRAQPSVEPCCLASMGIYVFNRAVLHAVLANTLSDFGKEICPASWGRYGFSRTCLRATGRTSARCAPFLRPTWR